MQHKVPLQSAHSPQASLTRRSSITFNAEQKRQIFKGMVVSELEAGFLRYSRRQELMQYAARMGIPEFEACLLIAEAQFRVGDIDPIDFESAVSTENLTRPERWSIPLRLSFTLAAAALIDVLVIAWLF